MRKPRPARNPLEPIATTVGCLTTLLIGVLLLSLLVHQAMWGNGPVCVSTHDADLLVGHVSFRSVAAGAQASVDDASVCANNPTSALRVAGQLAVWPYLILWLIFLWRLRGLLKAASQPGGLYSPETAARLRMLGWLLVLGGVAASIISSAANIIIFTRVVVLPGMGWFQPGQVNFSFTTLITGLALITVARVMVLGVKMREELDVTV